MASKQPQDRQLEAAAAYVKQYLTDQHPAGPPHAPHSAQHAPQPAAAQAPAPPQFLNQFLAPQAAAPVAVPPPPPPHQHQATPAFNRLVADFLKAQQAAAAGGAPGQAPAPAVSQATIAMAPLPTGLLASLQAAQAGQPLPAPMPAPHHPRPPAPHAAPPPALSIPQGPNAAVNAAQQQLLASAQLLSSVNPGLAAAAMAQALTMTAQGAGAPSPVNVGLQHLNPAGHPAHPAHPAQHAAHAAGHGAGHHAAPTPPVQGGSVASAPMMLGQPPVPSVAQGHPQHQPQAQPQPPPALSAGAAAAQYRQQFGLKQHAQPATAPSRPSFPAMAAGAPTHEQAHRPSSVPLAPPTKPETLHQVSSGSSFNTGSANGSNGAAPAKPAPSSPGKPARSSVTTSASLPSSGSGGSGLGAANGVAKGAVAAAAGPSIHRHRGHRGKAAAAAVSSSAGPGSSGDLSPTTSSGSVPHVPITTLQRWNLEQLEAHVKQLRESKQAVPQAVTLLLADTRRKEEKRHAKRLANRKSACTSRARKKALIEEMTKDNARLRRQALILSYLPDPVVAISTEGVITFCSMQVERVLKHDVAGLVGANIEDIIVPSSREAIRRLIRDLVIAERQALSSSVDEGDAGDASGGPREGARGESESDGGDRENDSGGGRIAHQVSEHSSEGSFPPLLEVKVKAGLTTSTEVGAGEDVSDSSGDPPSKNGQVKGSDATTPTEMSSLTHKNSSFGPDSNDSNEDQRNPPPAAAKKAGKTSGSTSVEKKPSTESDESTSSENKAGANLTKNVEMCKLNQDKMGAEEVRFSHKDDVMGASVTANNADAKLSSLMHHPRAKFKLPEQDAAGAKPSIQRKKRPKAMSPNGKSQNEERSASSTDSSLSKPTNKKQQPQRQRSGNSSEDSGYRQSPEVDSNEYPEDSSSSSAASSDRSSKKKRRRTRPLAPACNVRLIRNDLSTIWCELTSSIRTRPLNDVDKELNIVPPSQLKQGGNGANQRNASNGNVGGDESAVSSEAAAQEEKELLLCFRPIREGDAVGEELRFRPDGSGEKAADANSSSEDRKASGSANNGSSNDGAETAAGEAAASAAMEAASVGETQVAAPPPTSSPARKNRPPKKRKFEERQEERASNDKPSSRRRCSSDAQMEEPDEKSAVESMMELAKSPL